MAPVVPLDSASGPPVSPRSAFLRSLALPGLGQLALGRPRIATAFGLIEAASLFMTVKSRHNLGVAKRMGIDSIVVGVDSSVIPPRLIKAASPWVPIVHSRRQQVEDWTALLIFNHFISGAEAFVSAHLWDLPAHVSLVPSPRGLTLAASTVW